MYQDKSMRKSVVYGVRFTARQASHLEALSKHHGITKSRLVSYLTFLAGATINKDHLDELIKKYVQEPALLLKLTEEGQPEENIDE